MLKALRANLAADFIFFRRSRLVVLVALFTGFVWGTSLVPSLFFMSASDRFQLIKMLLSQSLGFVTVFAAALSVMTLSYTFNHRCLKMVLTKPCPPEIWLLAHHGAVLGVAAALDALLLAAACAAFWAWHIPVQWGIVYLVVESFLGVVAVVAVLSLLATVMHPFLAVILMLLANESTFHGLLTLLSAAVHEAATPAAQLGCKAAQVLTYALYLAVPSYSLFEHQAADVHRSLRLAWADLGWLGWTALYTALLAAMCFALAALALRRRRHT